MALTAHDICMDADAFRRAYPAWPSPEPAAPPVFRPGDPVSYLGHPAVIVHGSEPDGWTGGIPAAIVNIRFARPVPGMSRQMDVPAGAVLPAPAAVAALLDAILPARTTLPPVPDGCQSCGHIPDTCPCTCC